MQKKRKISIRKVLQVLLTAVVTTCCVIAMASASKLEGEKYLATVAVHIKNGKKYHFIEQQQIMDLAVNNRHVDIMHTPLSRLDILGIERAIKSDPWVAEAQAFVGMDRVLHMYVEQRVPVARIFEHSSSSCYMDATLHTMPLSAGNIFYTMVVTNVPELHDDSSSKAMKTRIYALVKAIQADTFWNAQISQVAVDSAGMFELVPVLGNHRILFGDTTGTREKLEDLFAFYKNVLNRIGWEKYEVLDVRFKGQVVASPSLPYKGPVDKAVDKMNWINSIVITEAQNDMHDSLRAADIKSLTNGAVADARPAAAIGTMAPGTAISKATIGKTAVVAGSVAAGAMVAKQLVKPATAKQAVAAKPVVMQARQQPGLKAPGAPTAKGTIKASPVPAVKPQDKKKAVKTNDKKKIRTAAKAVHAKPALKKTVKMKVVKKEVIKKGAAGSSNETNTKKTSQGAAKYAYPGGH